MSEDTFFPKWVILTAAQKENARQFLKAKKKDELVNTLNISYPGVQQCASIFSAIDSNGKVTVFAVHDPRGKDEYTMHFMNLRKANDYAFELNIYFHDYGFREFFGKAKVEQLSVSPNEVVIFVDGCGGKVIGIK